MRRHNPIYMPILLLVCLPFFETIAATHSQSECRNQTIISHFLSESFNANIHFIRRGVPSKVVDFFYKHALSAVFPKCLCDANTLSMLCTRLIFNSHLSIKALQNLADLHPREHLFKEINLFPLYNPHKRFLNLTPSQVQLVQSHQQGFLHFISLSHTNIFSPRDWTIRIFPPDDSLFMPEERDARRACTSYNALAHGSQLSFSAALTTAYAISVVQIVRFANGDIKAATRLLQQHVQKVYDSSLCLGKSGDNLPIPASTFDQLSRQSKLLVGRSLEKLHKSPVSFLQFYQYYLPAPNDMENFHQIASLAYSMYPELVDQFSSTLSAGQVQTYLDYKNYGGVSAVRRLTEELLASTSPYKFLRL